MARKYDERQKQWAAAWDAEHLDRISVALPKGYKEEIRRVADAAGESVNLFIRRAIESRMRKEGQA